MRRRTVVVVLTFAFASSLGMGLSLARLGVAIGQGIESRKGPGVSKETPKYLLVFRRANPMAVEPNAPVGNESRIFQNLDDALKFAESMDLDDDSLIGIWELGQPLKVSANTKETTETVRKKKREWRKSPGS